MEDELEETLGLDKNQDEPQADGQQPDQLQQDQLPELSAEEQRAWDDGWRHEEEYEGDPTRWKTAREYNMYGDHQKELRSLKEDQRAKNQDFEDRLTGVNKLHQAQLEIKVNELKSDRRKAVEMADTDEYDRIQTQIEEAEKQPEPVPPAQPGKDPLIADWESKNAWIGDGSQKASDASAMWNAFSQANPNGTIQQALAHVDKQIERLYPSEQPSNPRREQPSMNERPTQTPRRTKGRELTMNDLNADEKECWNKFGSQMYKNEKEFLKTVADARKS